MCDTTNNDAVKLYKAYKSACAVCNYLYSVYAESVDTRGCSGDILQAALEFKQATALRKLLFDKIKARGERDV